MTAALGNTAQGTPFATGVDSYVYPQFIGYALRAPTTNDICSPGTEWQDNSVSPPVIYQTTGAGIWYAILGSAGAFSSLTVVGTSSLTGTTDINTTGAAATNIGTGTGTVTIGNATGNTLIDSGLVVADALDVNGGDVTVATGDLVLASTGSKLVITAGANCSVGTTAALSGGTLVVNNTAITNASVLFFTTRTLGTVTVAQSYRVSSRTAGVSFTITSSAPTDTSTVDYIMIN